MSREELAHVLQQHLDSLKAAGVEWLPSPPLRKAPPALASVRAPAAVQPALPEPPRVPPARPAPALAPATPQRSEVVRPPSPPVRSAAALQPQPTETTSQPGTVAARRVALEVLDRKVSTCTLCPELVVTRTRTVFGIGQPGVELCLIGEAPGAEEDAQGEPFVGRAGQMLNRILAACGLKREELYICNSIKCRPPGNRTPQPDELTHCRGYLEEQIELVRPKFICTLGGSAVKSLLQTTQSLGSLRGRFHDYRGISVMCTYHPSFLLPHRHPEKKRDVWEDMKMLMARMGRPVK